MGIIKYIYNVLFIDLALVLVREEFDILFCLEIIFFLYVVTQN